MRKFALLLVSIPLCLAGCKKGDSHPGTPTAGHNLYILGRDSIGLCYWKNGARVAMPADAQQTNSSVSSICASGNDVYVAGGIDVGGGASVPAYWKNGKSVVLTNSSSGSATAIALLDTNVYIAGILTPYDEPVYWANANSRTLILDQNLYNGTAEDLCVSGGNVYTCGMQFNGGSWIATYWTNENPTNLTYGGVADANGIFVSGSDVYCAGSYNGAALYWKNGQGVALAPNATDGVLTPGRIIYTSGSDVYVVGRANGVPACWKNGTLDTLSNQGTGTGAATCIIGAGTDVFVGGSPDSGVWGYWLNGVFTRIQGCSFIFDIFVE